MNRTQAGAIDLPFKDYRARLCSNDSEPTEILQEAGNGSFPYNDMRTLDKNLLKQNAPADDPSPSKRISLGTIALVVSFCISVVTTIWGISFAHDAMRVRNWPNANGTILESTIKTVSSKDSPDQRLHYEPEIIYTYDVEGVVYTSDRVRIGTSIAYDARVIQDLVERYPPNVAIMVWYDPDNPEYAILLPEERWGTLLVPALGAAMLFTCIVWTIWPLINRYIGHEKSVVSKAESMPPSMTASITIMADSEDESDTNLQSEDADTARTDGEPKPGTASDDAATNTATSHASDDVTEVNASSPQRLAG